MVIDPGSWWTASWNASWSRSASSSASRDSFVALAREPRVVVIPDHAVGVVLLGESWEFLGRVAVRDDEVAATLAIVLAKRIERIEEARDPSRTGVVEDRGIEDEHRENDVVLGSRRERTVVRHPEVATMPVDSHGLATWSGFLSRRVTPPDSGQCVPLNPYDRRRKSSRQTSLLSIILI